jgi:hypothetical protein
LLSEVALSSGQVSVRTSRPARLRVSIQPFAGRSRALTVAARRPGLASAPLRPALGPGSYVVTVRATTHDGRRSQGIRTVRVP